MSEKCSECGKTFEKTTCPENVCPTCGKDCVERVRDTEDGGEWDICDHGCPYSHDDEIDYDALEKAYPPPPDECMSCSKDCTGCETSKKIALENCEIKDHKQV
jgi:DNA-directed RNA polymerase subunit RPC12/RpoP